MFNPIGHSPTASMFGFCECDSCRNGRGSVCPTCGQSIGGTSVEEDPLYIPYKEIENYHLFTIRCRFKDAPELDLHRSTLKRMGYAVGPSRGSDGTGGLPIGWCYFRCNVKKDSVIKEDMDYMVKWDQRFGEITKEEKDQWSKGL